MVEAQRVKECGCRVRQGRPKAHALRAFCSSCLSATTAPLLAPARLEVAWQRRSWHTHGAAVPDACRLTWRAGLLCGPTKAQTVAGSCLQAPECLQEAAWSSCAQERNVRVRYSWQLPLQQQQGSVGALSVRGSRTVTCAVNAAAC